jgi:hypothetical protein
MPFEQLTPRPFNSVSVRMYAPLSSGVYGISNAQEWIYIGETEDIRTALLAHLQDSHGALMKRKPTGFVFEICAGTNRPVRQGRLVSEYAPACNRNPSRYL